MRDKPRGPRPEAPARSRAQEERSSKQYRAQLDALFEKGEVGKFAEKLLAPSRQPPALRDLPAKKAEPAPGPAEPPPPAKDDPRAVLRKKVLAAIGRDDISRAYDKYVKAHGVPKDFELLEQALEHHKPDRVSEALAALDQLLDREKPKRSRSLVGKLRFLEETSDEAELRASAERVRHKLGG